MLNKEEIVNLINKSIETKEKVKKYLVDDIKNVAEIIINTLKNGNKILICGNGGSAADSQHFAGELVGRFIKERKGLPALALTVDSSILTAWANDYSFDTVFSRQVEALGTKNDILFSISTSGNSKNCIEAINLAKKKGLKTISLLGKDGGRMKEISDYSIIVPYDVTFQIQESHIMIIHIICYLIDNQY